MNYHDYVTTETKRLHMSQHTQQKIFRNSTASINPKWHVLFINQNHRPPSAGRPLYTGKTKFFRTSKGFFLWRHEYYKNATYNNKIINTQKLQKNEVKWYHTYILHIGLNRMEATIHEYTYYPGIRTAVQKGVTRSDLSQRKKWSAKMK